MTETLLHTRVVRALGSSKVHVVDVISDQLQQFTIADVLCTGIELPIATRCGAMLRRNASKLAVCMNPTTRITCSRCRMVTGMQFAKPGNQDVPGS